MNQNQSFEKPIKKQLQEKKTKDVVQWNGTPKQEPYRKPKKKMNSRNFREFLDE